MKNLIKALADFQQECPVIKKEAQGYQYKYADLPSILEVVNPLLTKHGLMFTQPLMFLDDIRYIDTLLYHIESGECLKSMMVIPEVSLGKMNDYQALGSGITYIRRYALSSILGIVTDEDTDAAGEQIPKEESDVKYTKMKELPWLTQKMFDTSVRRIQEADPKVHIIDTGEECELTPDEFLDKLTSSYRMKKTFKESLQHEIDFQKTLNKQS